ncbi:HutD/Ves family protein [Rhizobium halophytocola]|uniref:Environmental stress-induced protein Ves n=1 Tax=Rhizobium halophytocola TaxID=735519 RepID=A0ABS4DU47_9HYPH|nr:HutD family protein [Rhizobium halophytocola]MBP1849224.1 environmental stress-induced protein Ves [Rhizobium halophytocola]
MRILRAGDYKTMPWKNGGGETTEVLASPPGASLNDFDWRVSMATVAADGPFSSFPGIDRTLSILDGAGMTLSIGDGAPVTLETTSPPLTFAADAPTTAWLVDGPIRDLNVMSRRGRVAHAVERQKAPAVLPPRGTVRLLLALGELTIAIADQRHDLGPLDCILLEADDDRTLAVEGAGEFTLVTFAPAAIG